MRVWAKPKIDRSQPQLMAASLDERIGKDHGIRLLDELLSQLDWSEWEGTYSSGGSGRPPIHPRLMAGSIIYGLLKKIHSTRDLEEATCMRLDFQWFLEGRTVDHTTFSTFKKRFDGKIEEVFKQINRLGAELRNATLEEIVVDGSQLRANSNRHGACTARALERRLEKLEERLRERLAQLECDDDEPQEGDAEAHEQLELEAEGAESESKNAGQPRDRYDQEGCEDLKAQRTTLEKALEETRRRDQNKGGTDSGSDKAVRVPVSDPDSWLMPNKEGGYAPNYTPVVAVESEHGLIVAATVAEGYAESATVSGLVMDCRELREGGPKRVCFDGNFGSGSVLEELSAAGIAVYAPVGAVTDNPAQRPDGSVPIEEGLIDSLPKRGKQFDKAAFLYDEQRNGYWCPMGRWLETNRTVKRKNADGSIVMAVEYRCQDCSNCPLAAKCLRGKAKLRRVSRDQYEHFREELAQHMSSEESQEIYARRAPVVEGTIGTIKSAMGVRRFLRRGKRKVQADWTWTCAAYNLGKLIRAGQRALQGLFTGHLAPSAPRRGSGGPPRARGDRFASIAAFKAAASKSHTRILIAA